MEAEERKEKVTKQLIVVTDPRGIIKLAWEGGGELPAILSGTYTSVRAAQIAADSYISNVKEKPNAKSKNREAL